MEHGKEGGGGTWEASSIQLPVRAAIGSAHAYGSYQDRREWWAGWGLSLVVASILAALHVDRATCDAAKRYDAAACQAKLNEWW